MGNMVMMTPAPELQTGLTDFKIKPCFFGNYQSLLQNHCKSSLNHVYFLTSKSYR
jgi:hypothetical protein